MTMVFQRFQTQGIAQLSYLIGDDSAGTAAVNDARPNVDVYLDAARQYGVTITRVFETHIHADFMSGARELVDRLGGRNFVPAEKATRNTVLRSIKSVT